MHRVLAAALLAAIALTSTAQAKDRPPTAWQLCDGYPEPTSAGEDIGRLVVVLGTFGLLGLKDDAKRITTARGKDGIEACAEVLGAPLLEHYWARHVSVVTARAIHYLEAKNPDAALADINSIASIARDHVNDPYYQNTISLKAKLLTSMAYLVQSNLSGLHESLVDLSPRKAYGGRFQMTLLEFLYADPSTAGDAVDVWRSLLRVSPQSYKSVGVVMSWTDNAEARADFWESALATNRLLAKRLALRIRDREESRRRRSSYAKDEPPASLDLGPDPLIAANAAVAAARAGRYDRANELISLAQVVSDRYNHKSSVPKRNKKRVTDDEKRLAEVTGSSKNFTDIHEQVNLVDAFLFAHDGDFADANKAMKNTRFRNAAAALDLVSLVAAHRSPAGASSKIVDDTDEFRSRHQDRARTRALARIDYETLVDLIPTAQRKRSISSYSKRILLGIKPTGFKEKKDPDGLGYHIEFLGNTFSRAAAEEMVILRAAAKARDAHMPAFVVLDRRDYTQRKTMTYNGIPTGPSWLSGYRTDVDVMFVDPDNLPAELQSAKDRVLMVDDVWAALAPTYVPERQR